MSVKCPMSKRFQISLPDEVAATLETLSEDCSLTQSVVITQLIVRYHPQIRGLLATNCNLLQPTATSVQPTPQSTSDLQPTPLNVPLPHGDVLSTQDIVPTSQDISPGTAFLAMDFET